MSEKSFLHLVLTVFLKFNTLPMCNGWCMDPIAVQRTQKTVVKSSTFYLDSGRQANGLETGKQESGEAKFLVRDGRLGRITSRQTKQGSREAGKQGSREAGKQGSRDRQETAGKTCMAKNNLAKE